jgi:hypothetical protein
MIYTELNKTQSDLLTGNMLFVRDLANMLIDCL